MPALTFQEIIMRLDAYWAEHGCLVLQPYDVEVGAGTNAPATFLRVLGPEPWNVAYPQPSRRPDDGRYAENPNRYQHYFQYQVILKPAPTDPIGLYLASLAALGLSDRYHDVRFVEDNWESPSLGAWGLGWEVWLDGLEITQFTYFQQAGLLNLVPPSVEITYGLERIAMHLQGVRDMAEIHWNERITYGDLYRRSEIEDCTYNFELADVDGLRAVFDFHEREAGRAIAAGLVSPGLGQVLKCSHLFNILDARGAVSVQQRANYLGRMRDLARRVAQAYVAQREELGFPLSAATVEADRPSDAAPEPSMTVGDPARRADFVLELGVEELPADDVASALEQLRAIAPTLLAGASLTHGDIEVCGSPRRLVVQVAQVGVLTASREETIKGPPASVAYDGEGQPTQAALGFARRAGVDVADLERQDVGGTSYVVAHKRIESPPAPELLKQWAEKLLGAVRFDRPMYWQSPSITFSRPIRWIVALWGDAVVPIHFAGVTSGRCTPPPRGAAGEGVDVDDASTYGRQLRDLGVVLDGAERRSTILEGGRELAAAAGGVLEDDPALLEEVGNLVEWPKPLLGSFDPEYLEAPSAALVTVMKKHQRYFPVRGDDGRLLPSFVAVANGRRPDPSLVVRGNEEVLRARFADALYFYRLDLRAPLASRVEELARLTFMQGLGSMLDKTRRLEATVGAVADELESAAPRDKLARAAHLAKADLATSLVRELTELQGEMGREYALRDGEDPEVAEAVADHYRPRAAGDAMPSTALGLVVGTADRVDTLVAGFAAGLEPTGSSDPYGLRRAALGLIGALVAAGNPASLSRLIEIAAERSPAPLSDERRAALGAFLRQRLRVALVEAGHRPEVVDSVLAAQADRPSPASRTVRSLEAAIGSPDLERLLGGIKRADRILPRGERFQLRPDGLTEPADRELLQAYRRAAERATGVVADDVAALVAALLPLADPIDRFFDGVMVNVDDPELRAARLGLLQAIRDLPSRAFDVARFPTATPKQQ